MAEPPRIVPPEESERLPIHWTDEARRHLTEIHAHIAGRSPQYAKRVIDRLTRRSQQLAAFPLSGSAVPELTMPQLRQVIEGPYRVIYHIRPDRIDVIAVFHGARQSPWSES